jgi:hypothetical protein
MPRRDAESAASCKLYTPFVQRKSMKIIVSVLAVAWLVSGCASLTTAPDDDSVTGANLDARTNLCTDATPPPCEPPRD